MGVDNSNPSEGGKMRDKVYPAVGERVRVIGNYSGVMMHFGLAGKPVEVALLDGFQMAQVYKDGKPFSAPITVGEAGFYEDPVAGGFYIYPDYGPGDADPKQVARDLTKMVTDAIDGAGVPVTVITDLGLNF